MIGSVIDLYSKYYKCPEITNALISTSLLHVCGAYVIYRPLMVPPKSTYDTHKNKNPLV